MRGVSDEKGLPPRGRLRPYEKLERQNLRRCRQACGGRRAAARPRAPRSYPRTLPPFAALALAVLDGTVDKLGVLGLLGGGEDEGRVGGGILGLVLGDGCGNMVSDAGLWKMYR